MDAVPTLVALAVLAWLPYCAFSGGEEIVQDAVTAEVVMDLAVEGVLGRWDARRSLSGRIQHLDDAGRESEPYRSEVLNRRHKAQIILNANETYTWRAETGEVLRGRWARTGRLDEPVMLLEGERGNNWTVTRVVTDGAGTTNADFQETTGTLCYKARRVEVAVTSGTVERLRVRSR